MNKAFRLALTLVTLAASCLPVAADGLVYNGHISGSYTTLTLNAEQISALSRGKNITLTAPQQNTMLRKTGIANVKKIHIYPRTVGTCTCEESNVGIRINRTTIEVADALFGRDLRAEADSQVEWSRWHYEATADEKKVSSSSSVPKEVQLLTQAQRLVEERDQQKATSLLEQAVAINPKYRPATRALASKYRETAGEPYESDKSLQTKVALYKKALALLSEKNDPLAKEIQRDLARVNSRIAASAAK
ncbi:MAG: hypothetical protein U0105_09320 [Candidatus Obscuribacterales bacterium]